MEPNKQGPPSPPNPYGGYGSYGNYGYGSYGGYPNKPVSVMWSKARIQMKRYGSVLSRFGWLLPVTVSLGVCLAAWIVAQMPADYISESRMMVSGQFQLPKEGAVYNEQLDNYYGTQIQLMQSLEVRKGALGRVQTLHPEIQPEMVTLTVVQEPRASVFNLSAEGSSSAFAQAYLEAVMSEYLEVKKKERLQKSENTTLAIQDELARLNKEIEVNDQAMHDFQKANNIGFIQQEGNDAAVYLAARKREVADLKSEFNLLSMMDLDQNLDRTGGVSSTAQASATNDGSAPKSAPENLANLGPIADYQKAKADLQVLLSQKADMAHNLRPAHPSMIALEQQIEKKNDLIETLRGQSVEALKTRRESISIQIKNLDGTVREWEAKALDLSSRIAEFDRIKAKADRAKEQYEQMIKSMNGVTVTKNIDQESVMIMDHASEGVSVKPGWPKIILIGLVGGLLVGLGVLFCIDQLDDRIGSFIELQTHFQERILGQIPRDEFKGDAVLLRHNDDRLAVLEAFRSLRSSLIFFPVEGMRPKTLIITSALPNEGKTTISANLAITLAFSGARTLIIDADMRRGRLSYLFGINEGNGLSSVLLKTLPWREALHKTTIDNLSLLSCGPPLKHPAEHLLGKVADEFLKEIYDQFDYVIFDSPPVTLLDDTLSIAPKVDGAMVVVRFGVSSVRTTRRTLELLGQRQTNILGLICNDVKLSESEYNYGYYYRQTVDKYTKEIRTPA